MFSNAYIKNRNKNGFALLELMVSVSIFIVLIVTTTTVYIRFLEQNRQTQELRQLTDQVRVLAERIRDDLNSAKKDTNGTTLCHQGPFPRVYSQFSPSNIFFVDSDGTCSAYFLSYDSVADTNTVILGNDLLNNPTFSSLTTPSVNTRALRFTVYEAQFTDQQPLVDIFFELERKGSTLPSIPVSLSSTYLVQ